MIKIPSPALPRDYVDCASKVRWDNALGQPMLQGERCFAYLENDQVQVVTMDATPVTTVPRPEIENTSSTLIKKAISTGLGGNGI